MACGHLPYLRRGTHVLNGHSSAQLTRVPNAHARPLLSRVPPFIIAAPRVRVHVELLLNSDTLLYSTSFSALKAPTAFKLKMDTIIGSIRHVRQGIARRCYMYTYIPKYEYKYLSFEDVCKVHVTFCYIVRYVI